MRITFKIRDYDVVMARIEFDDNDKMTGREGKQAVMEYLKEQFENEV